MTVGARAGDIVDAVSGDPRVGPPLAEAAETEIDGRISVLNPLTERVLMLNETASDVWRLADGEHTLEEMTRLLARTYGVPPDQIRADVEAVVATLRAEGLLRGEPE